MNNTNLKELLLKTKSLILLYVEDDEDIAAKTIEVLTELFDKIVYAKDGIEGVEKYKEHHIDLIISAIDMPYLNGFGMLEHIKKIDKNTPAIITTAHTESDYYQEALDLNVQGYILKPVEVDKLLLLIKDIVDQKQTNDIKHEKLSQLKNSNEKLLQIADNLTKQQNSNKLLESILLGAIELSDADGATLYIMNNENQTLDFSVAINRSLNIHFGGSGDKINLPSLRLHNSGNINQQNIIIASVEENTLINIENIYESSSYDFSGNKNFDNTSNYNTRSMLVIPIINTNNEIFGVIQLINKIDTNTIVSFNSDDETILTSLASLASMILSNQKSSQDLDQFLHSLVQSITSEISNKSHYTNKHVNKVVSLVETLLNAIDKDQTTFSNISFTTNQKDEIKLASWLHDIGKITTPVEMINKKTKLEAVFNRMEIIEARFEVLKKDLEISYLKNEISDTIKDDEISRLDDDLEFINKMNNDYPYMTNEHIQKLNNIFLKGTVTINNKTVPLIKEDELYNLSIKKGTLTKEEKDTVNKHVINSYDMLKNLHFPDKYKNVSKIVGLHKQTLDEKGTVHDELINTPVSIGEKILAVADMFESLSAYDRPYRSPNTLNQIVKILIDMVQKKQLDKDIVKLFLEEKLYLDYVNRNFLDEQIDEIIINLNDIEYR